MFGISGEHILILGAVLLIFGPKKLPQLGQSLGRGIRNFKDALSGVEEASYKKVEDQNQADAAQKKQASPSSHAPSQAASHNPSSNDPPSDA